MLRKNPGTCLLMGEGRRKRRVYPGHTGGCQDQRRKRESWRGGSAGLYSGLCREGCGSCGITCRRNWSTSRGLRKGGGGAADILCHRACREALMGETLLSRAEEVGRVATMDWMVPNWVVMVSS